MPTAPAVVIFFRSPLLGTIISHPGSMAFAVFLLNRDVFVLLYLKNGLKNFKNLFESTSLYEQRLNAFLSPSLGLLLSETYRWV